MHVVDSIDVQDSFQDSLLTGVKYLFEASENELLPIEDQLKLYKKRNLQASHGHRISRKVFGAQKPLWRHYRVEEDPFDAIDSSTEGLRQDHEISSLHSNVLSKKVAKPVNKSIVDDEKISCQITTQWINERKQLRENLKNLGQIKTWLERKKEKTCLEEKVLQQLSSTSPEIGSSRFLQASKSLSEESVAATVRKIARVLKDKPLMSVFNKYEKSPATTRQEFSNDLSKIQEHTKLSSKEKENLFQFYFSDDRKPDSFHTALGECISSIETSESPFITVTPAPDGENKKPIRPLKVTKEEDVSYAKAIENQRHIRLKEYEETVKRCQERDVSIPESQLRKVILHPEDHLKNSMKVRISNRNLLSESFWKVREKKRYRRRRRRESILSSVSPESSDTDSKISHSPESHSFIVLPPLRDVAPEKHHVNLSTGRALVGRKVDCWLTAEEYGRLTCNPVGVPFERERSNPNAFWPGQPLDKLRICMTPCDSYPFSRCDRVRSKGGVFHTVGVRPHNGKKSNYGYNNNELTWPTDGKYIKYGDIDQNKKYII